MVEQLYQRYFDLTGEASSAAMLVLAHSNLHGQAGAPDILTVKQAADRLGVSSATIYNMCDAGKLTHKRVGKGRGSIRIKAEDLFGEAPSDSPLPPHLAAHLAPPARGRGRPKAHPA